MNDSRDLIVLLTLSDGPVSVIDVRSRLAPLVGNLLALCERGMVEEADRRWQLTAAGETALASVQATVAERGLMRDTRKMTAGLRFT